VTRVPARLKVTRAQVLAFRRRIAYLDERLPRGTRSLRTAAWAGLQDSMPRAAVLSLHARLEGVAPGTWEDPSLVQTWGPRFSTYVVPARDLAYFTLGRLSDNPARRRYAEDMAARLHAVLDGKPMHDGEAGRALGIHPTQLRYAATTGTVLIRWDGARAPAVWTVPAPRVDPAAARRELARRYLHVFGPGTPSGFAEWAGIRSPKARGGAVFESLGTSLVAVTTPLGDAWILAEDESALRAAPGPAASARLLPSGDTYTLVQGAEREFLVADAAHRESLWTPRVWPGSVLVMGELVGTWRRATNKMTIAPWKRLSRDERDAVESEASGLPVPGVDGHMIVRWER
jgi:hypothetical protein